MKEFVLKLARRAVEEFAKTGKRIEIPKERPKEADEKRGVFVTLFKKGELRGCIGFPYPEKTMVENIVDASRLVCQDPRFEPLRKEELKDIRIEVSILTEPKLIETKPEDYEKEIELGKDGLIIRSSMFSGLFLPQVPIEQKWNLEEYLENLCYKAGLHGDAWKDSSSKLYKFQAIVFSEGI
ncbi:MAG: TIGR00296 family protein [Candidatus Aenigmarchaeota archaeon]|nr:TIGR00296 family protein [Candidatus Aenigmarchaeota archaeon]